MILEHQKIQEMHLDVHRWKIASMIDRHPMLLLSCNERVVLSDRDATHGVSSDTSPIEAMLDGSLIGAAGDDGGDCDTRGNESTYDGNRSVCMGQIKAKVHNNFYLSINLFKVNASVRFFNL